MRKFWWMGSLALTLFAVGYLWTRQPSALYAHQNVFRGPASEGDECTNPSDEVTPAQMQAITPMMAARDHRLWHLFWHETRNSWHHLTPSEREAFTALNPNWAVPRLLGAPDDVPPENRDDVAYDPEKNGAGEDFLYMHHQMIGMVQASLKAANQPCIRAWSHVPDADDQVWPVSGEKVGIKSDAGLTQLKKWEAAFRDPAWLQQHSLSSLGYVVEITLHNNLHMRWADDQPPAGFGERPDIPDTGVFPQSWTFDQVGYDWLADPYGAHVNPRFWKLHGLVDSLLKDWLRANGFERIENSCKDGSGRALPRCYAWRGLWVGAAPGLKVPPEAKAPLPRSEAQKQSDRATFHFVHKHFGKMDQGELNEATLNELKNSKEAQNDPAVFVREIWRPRDHRP